MRNITADTKYGEITIQGITFDVPQPYKEGDVLTSGEASALNQTYAENCRNNFASNIKAAKEEAAKTNSVKVDDVTNEQLDLVKLAEDFETYATKYEFGVRAGGVARITDPIEREAMNIARAKVREAIKKQNIKLEDVPKEQIESLARGLLAKYPSINEEATRRVNSVKEIAMEEIQIEPATNEEDQKQAAE